MKHRKEEDDLYRKFAHHREEEDRRIREEFRVRNESDSKKNNAVYSRGFVIAQLMYNFLNLFRLQEWHVYLH